MDDLLHQAEALLRFSTDLETRMVDSGVGGVNGIIERFVELRQALERVSDQELDWARGEVQTLVAVLSSVGDQLEQLQAIKGAFPVIR
jgi:tRNA G37 N-methylase TrmD